MKRIRVRYVSAGILSICPILWSPVQGAELDTYLLEGASPPLGRQVFNETLAVPIAGSHGREAVDVAAIYRLPYSASGGLIGGVGNADPRRLGLPASNISRYAGLDTADPEFHEQWLRASGRSSAVTVGYAWQDVAVEGTAVSSDASDVSRPGEAQAWKLDGRSARLSFRPVPGWMLRLSRGSVSGLDQLVPGSEVRRTAISATYERALQSGDLQTTMAWGRSARKGRESTMGYLLESTWRFDGTQAVFGRLEQVGSDDLLREDESMQRQSFKLNKVTLGYYRQVQVSNSMRMDVGAFASRHRVPDAMSASYGDNPTSYIMFLRFKLQ